MRPSSTSIPEMLRAMNRRAIKTVLVLSTRLRAAMPDITLAVPRPSRDIRETQAQF